MRCVVQESRLPKTAPVPDPVHITVSCELDSVQEFVGMIGMWLYVHWGV